ncbi:hypothetical protein EUGRSUZ_J02381 [Eucalyptus grandis]|uniref:Uncharacterized protein n=3 Tax=Eucalyptus grandis TaxID=71139 RepID=A0A059AGX2_EUCGR|nr:hypothetical protein EUGRSUZ_J02381 [Eucalyptus grandis]KAK3410382.1 hypothetical protein EUGRSUZ_J02381 [Eucalyptus grandis]
MEEEDLRPIRSLRRPPDVMVEPSRLARSPSRLRVAIALAVVWGAIGAASVVVPSTNCYALDNTGRLVDFSSWIGHVFEYEEKEEDLVVRFCKDVETRSNLGFVAFGRFDKFNHFTAGSGHIDFVQRFYNGDLRNCEKSYDKMGRTAQVNIICGSCSKSQCKGELGCICNVTYESTCRVLVELAIPCEDQGPRVFEGFTVGFHPRSWEIVYNGLTQPGFEKSYPDFSFRSEQTHVALYMTAISSHSNLVQKPIVKVFPENGLDVKLSGSAMTGRYPTTLSPTTLILDWRCETPRDSPYEVEITVPVDSYEPVHFTLSKICGELIQGNSPLILSLARVGFTVHIQLMTCHLTDFVWLVVQNSAEHRQDAGGDAVGGWAVFGILSCMYY